MFYSPVLTCTWSNIYDPHYKIFNMGIVVAFFLIPLMAILISNAMIVYAISNSARKVRHVHNAPVVRGSSDNAKNNNAVVTLVYICGAFVVSYLPYVTTLVLKSLNVAIPIWVDLLQPYFTSINSTANPIIFLFNNTAFRSYLRRRIYGAVQ